MLEYIYYIFYWLSRSPILSITMDESFHDISNKNKLHCKLLRYSLVSIGFGTMKVYLVTYKKGEGFKFLKILRLNEIMYLPTEEEVTQKVKSYKEHIETKANSDIEAEIDFLKYKIADEESVKSTASGKVNNYSAILLVLIPLIFASGLKFVLEIKSNILIIISVAILYNIVNLIVFIFDFYKVKGFLRSNFGDLKKSENHIHRLAESYYEDWYSIKSEAPIFVTYVTNIERYMKMTIIFMVLFIIFSNINFYDPSISKDKVLYQSGNYSIDISLSKTGELKESDLNELNDIQGKLLKNQVKQIIILKDGTSNDLINKKCHLIIDTIMMYNVNSIDITEITENAGIDKSKEEDYLIKILMIGGTK